MPDNKITKQLLQKPPSQPLSIYGGHLRAFWHDRTGFLIKNAELGDVSYLEIGSQPIYFLNHPDHIREIFVGNVQKFTKGRAFIRARLILGNGLVTSEREFHLRQRRMIQPAFHRERIAGYVRSMVEYGDQMAREWQDGETMDIDREMMRLTLQVVGKALFGVEMHGEADEFFEALTTAIKVFNYMEAPFSDLLDELPEEKTSEFTKAIASLDRIVYAIINEHRLAGKDTGDLLSMLLLAQDEDDGTGMTDEQVRDEALTLFLAGHETTANAMTWMWYLLSQNPEKEAKLHAELQSVLGDRLPSLDDVSNLKYTEAVFAESMRLYPPVWSIGRHTAEAHEFGGYTVPEGSIVMVSQYVMHRDARFWGDPNDFVPERWEKMSIKEANQRYIYFPFGSGTRRCIGESFSWAEGVILIAILARKWKLRLDPGQRIATDPLITMRPKYGMKMKIESV